MHALRRSSEMCLGRVSPRFAPALVAVWVCVLTVAASSRAAEAPPEQRVVLERIALAKARGELVEKVYALKLGASGSVGDWAASDLGRDRALRLWLRRMAAHGAARAYSDGSCDVCVRLEPAVLAQKLGELATAGAAATSGAGRELAAAGSQWPVLWGQGSAWRAERKLADQPEGWEEITSEGMAMTRRAAEADARRALFDSLGELSVTRARRLDAFLESGAAVHEAVAAGLQQSAAVEVVFGPDQVASATARIGLVDLIRLLTEVCEKSYRGDLFHAADFGGMGLLATVDEVSATGMAVPPAAAVSRPRRQGGDLEAPSWAAARMTANGRYELAENEQRSAVEAIEAARLAGIEELRRGVRELVVSDRISVSDFFSSHAELRDDFELFLGGARLTGPPTSQPGGVVEVSLELPLKRLWWIVRSAMQPVEVEVPEDSASQPAEKGAL